MSPSQKYRDKKNGYSSSDDQSVEAPPTSHSSAEDKTQALKHPALLDDDDNDQSSVASTPSEPESSTSTISYIQLPAKWQPKEDDCDEAEKRARKRRCDEIMRLSAKIVAEAKAAANIRHLKWAAPTFDPFPNSNKSSAPIVSQQAVSGKRERRQEDAGGHYMCFPGRQPTSEEVQSFADFANKMIPTGKRRRSSSESDE
jgi:hypothetical protein